MSYFSELGLAEPILRALAAKGYTDPSPIQRQAIPALLEGRDILGIAQTGTGKTAAFSLPSLHRLANDPKPRTNAGCRMLVLSPTRELAAQIAENMRGYAKFLNLSVQCIFGGVPAGKQARALERGTDILVATPGRLLDLIDSRALTLRHVEIFVLDEADQMMDLGFIVPLKRVANLLPKQRQSLFFSATMPQAIAELGKQFINNPVKVEVAPQSTTAERVEQYATFINQAEKQALLTISLRDGLAEDAAEKAEHGAIDRALVFTRTKHGADRVVRHLVAAGIPAAAIHGNKSQAQRTAALGGFRQGTVRVLVATDIAARGIDVSGVSHVYNFEIPNVAEQYVHRIGRTARAGADGVAISYVAPDEKPYIRDIEKLTRVKLAALSLPEDFQKQAARLPAPSRQAPAAPQGNGRGRPGEGRRDGGRGGNRSQQPRGDRRDRPHGDRPHGDRPHGDRPQGDRPQGERTERRGDERRRDDRPRSDAPRGDRREHGGEEGERKRSFRPRGGKTVGTHKGAVRRAS
ncbi:ATP-dependent RNA helicase RhlE [Novosphingobium sp. PhB57]|uniref:DEAD/DEAH box helicase n=1 Tax=unclassified Novosphingobium TaxID=2644732 RepID=UPI00104B4B97|nr:MULTISPECIES: DEAD/DEAH box helicase [unclassified Novosphingobium]TCU59418.1 ATP-dependent RNA helicase RhlE [Novosphingobium sp. PhB57]TDW63929.1 ATP-dependent RNA helicase RhlE [Novosphingobium sp. PhB55]